MHTLFLCDLNYQCIKSMSAEITANVLTYIITSYVEWARKGKIDPPSNKNFGLWVTSSNIKLCDKSDLFSLFAALSFEGMYNDLDPCRCASPICKCTMWFWLVKLTAPPERVPVVFPFPAFSCRVSGGVGWKSATVLQFRCFTWNLRFGDFWNFVHDCSASKPNEQIRR